MRCRPGACRLWRVPAGGDHIHPTRAISVRAQSIVNTHSDRPHSTPKSNQKQQRFGVQCCCNFPVLIRRAHLSCEWKRFGAV